MAGKKVLCIEDELDIRELLTFNLKREGYTVETAASGEEGIAMARAQKPDVVVLDLMLPGIDGLSVCRVLKSDEKTRRIPVVMLTAKSEDVDVVTGLEVGADDYVVKPFSPKVLVARIRAVMRRGDDSEDDRSSIISVNNLTIDPGRHEVKIDDQRIDLTPTEFDILACLASKPGWVYSRSQIVDAVRGETTIITDRAVDVQIVGLRKKLGEHGHLIETVRGVGYRFREV